MKLKQVIFLLLITSFVPITAFGADLESDGIGVLTRYLYALTRGDIDEAKTLIGGELLQKNQRLFSNPTYPQYLVMKYKNMRFEIIEATYLNENKINLSVLTTLENGETFTMVYTLVREPEQSIRIIAESYPQQG